MAGAFLEVALLVGTLPHRGECAGKRLCIDWDYRPHVVPLFEWRPFLDDPGEGSVAAVSGPRCPAATGSGAGLALIAAPLPAGYDPHGYPGRRIVACVRLSAAGEVTAVQLRGGTGRAGLDAALAARIASAWRFEASSGSEGWHRVRLNSDAPPLRL